MSLKQVASYKTHFIAGHNDLVAGWAGKILKIKDFGKCEALGIATKERLIAAVIFNNYYLDARGKPLSIEASIATIDKAWCTRHNLRTLFAYPFIQLDVKRLQITCSAESRDIRSFNERLGFQLEGIGREAWHLGGDAAVYSMLKHECRWLDVKRRELSSKSIHFSGRADREQYQLGDSEYCAQ